MPTMDNEKINEIFTYHPPTPEERGKYEEVNEGFIILAKLVNKLMPNGAGATVAIRKLADARMAVNAAIALKGIF